LWFTTPRMSAVKKCHWFWFIVNSYKITYFLVFLSNKHNSTNE
jgi:hypothetical protein